ncbi:MAG: peptidylprolyl isomerase [Actinomycetota bacterium]|nr:peptidylprolyl isomerase [Actinomycetota bacterium]
MTTRRLLLPALALAGAALGLSACNANVATIAARVGGDQITRAQLTDTLAAVNANSGFRCVITGGNTTKTVGAGASYSSAFTAQILTTLVENRALAGELRAQRLTVTPFARSIGETELAQALAPGQTGDASCTEQAQLVLASLSPGVRSQFVGLQAEEDLLAARSQHVELTPAGLTAWAKANPSQATLTCLSVAVFQTKAAADHFASQAKAGGASGFSSAATAAGTQAQSGCLQATTLPQPLGTEIASVHTGVVSSAFTYNGGYLVVDVTSRKAATGKNAAALLMGSLASRIGTIVASALASAEVHVDPAYGTWKKVSATYEVVPPKSPAPALLFNASAVESNTGSLG